ncbi:pseudouridine synthase 1 [Lasioglossum baleicum]|uniref:pseudouridine synthase 1 n=1 Tax=Lasioglossum baleicum TaxID=434251 RepID=UPI003FCD7677
MFSAIKYCSIFDSLPLFRLLRPQFASVYRSMSVQIDDKITEVNCDEKSTKRHVTDMGDNNDIAELNGAEKSTKRHVNDNNDDQIAVKVAKVEPTEKVKMSNFVIMMGYLGRDYFGMQRNPGLKTIEEDLMVALLKSKLILQYHFDDFRELKFQRAARTDKSVSAVRQIVSLKLPRDAKKEAINEHLPKEIRVFGLKRVTKGFNSKNQCDARTYRYVIPTFSLAPEDPNIVYKEDEDIDVEKRLEQLSLIDGKPYTEFRLTKDMVDKLNENLKLLEGTHNFHNFTIKVRPIDPSARRYIMYFNCVDIFVENDIEFAVLEIKGQSFMLHQIRKMISLIIGISRNIVTTDIVKSAFSLERIDIPMAPGLGLSLHHVHYKYYNKRYGNDGIHESLDWEECNKEVEQFYRDYILKNIIDTETTEKTTLNWLASSLTPKRFAFRDV